MSEINADTITKFCSSWDDSWNRGWVDNGKTYATNGQIAVRCNCVLDGIGPWVGKRRPPDIDQIMLHILDVRKWVPVSPPDHCDVCDDKYEKTVSCDACCGNGLCICSCCESEHECGHCDGSGKYAESCYCTTLILGRKIQNRYVRLLSEISAEIGQSVDGADRELYFRFDRGDGCVMPIAREKS